MTELNKSIATELVDLIDQYQDEKKSCNGIDELASIWWHKIRNDEPLHNNWISWTKEEKIGFIEKSSNRKPSTIWIPIPVCESNDDCYVKPIHKINNPRPSYNPISFSEFYNYVTDHDDGFSDNNVLFSHKINTF